MLSCLPIPETAASVTRSSVSTTNSIEAVHWNSRSISQALSSGESSDRDRTKICQVMEQPLYVLARFYQIFVCHVRRMNQRTPQSRSTPIYKRYISLILTDRQYNKQHARPHFQSPVRPYPPHRSYAWSNPPTGRKSRTSKPNPTEKWETHPGARGPPHGSSSSRIPDPPGAGAPGQIAATA